MPLCPFLFISVAIQNQPLQTPEADLRVTRRRRSDGERATMGHLLLLQAILCHLVDDK
jgi:hypothetical protein